MLSIFAICTHGMRIVMVVFMMMCIMMAMMMAAVMVTTIAVMMFIFVVFMVFFVSATFMIVKAAVTMAFAALAISGHVVIAYVGVVVAGFIGIPTFTIFGVDPSFITFSNWVKVVTSESTHFILPVPLLASDLHTDLPCWVGWRPSHVFGLMANGCKMRVNVHDLHCFTLCHTIIAFI